MGTSAVVTKRTICIIAAQMQFKFPVSLSLQQDRPYEGCPDIEKSLWISVTCITAELSLDDDWFGCMQGARSPASNASCSLLCGVIGLLCVCVQGLLLANWLGSQKDVKATYQEVHKLLEEGVLVPEPGVRTCSS